MALSYRYLKRPEHPLAPPSGRVGVHRLALYEKVGPGPVKCHWCPKVLIWSTSTRTADGVITTDHVDGDTLNNDPSNIVPSCHTCNVFRARNSRFADGLFVINKQSGVRERATERVCETCIKKFLIATKYLKKKNAGRYCSKLCLYSRNEFSE